MIKVLVLEQSKSVRNNLVERLEFEGYAVSGYSSVEMITSTPPPDLEFDIILFDSSPSQLPDHLRAIPFVIITHNSSIESALEAARLGALDMLTRPIDMNRLLGVIRSSVQSVDTETTTEPHRPTTPTPTRSHPRRRSSIAVEEMIGNSPPMVRLKELIDKIAPSEARVMILGENGTGKEMVAKWIHHKSHRASSPFVEINCAAIPSELIESELFGHEKGAFTSAIKQRKGKFEQADGGTLFMDEIGDMTLSAQAKVLRALQERKICRVGSDKDIDVNVRVIAATNKNIRAEIESGNFREDLYHRIGVIELRVTPLRQRREDIPLLVDHFLKSICDEYKISPRKSISPQAIEHLKTKDWSGNIRELRNIVERLVILSESEIVDHDIEVYCLS
ncbi:MAG: sigma-54 dependent transcriptional regulator [Rikenellaceae bacterium]